MQTFYVSTPRLARRGLAVFLSLLTGAAQAQITQIQQLNPATEFRSNLALYGNSVAIDGNVMVVGAPGDGSGGAIYVYERSGDFFTLSARLQADDKATLDLFGSAVAVAGTTVVVGAPGKDGGRGAVYVFGKTSGTWTQLQKLTASDRGILDTFGNAVAIAGSTIVVGASNDDTSTMFDHGSVYVFDKPSTTWTQTAKLTASDRAGSDNFGVAVSISGNTIAVGAHQEDNSTLNTSNNLSNAGSVYIFDKPSTTWNQTTKLTPSDRAVDDNFGRSVSLSGNTLVVGAPNRDESSVSNVGAAYVFDRSAGTWSQTTKLLASDPAASDNLGRSVSLSGSMIGAGAPGRDNIAGGDTAVNGGATYVFEKSGTWSQSARLVAADAADDDAFGIAVGVSNGVLAIGANGKDALDAQNGTANSAGTSYVFEKCTSPTVSITPASQTVCLGAQVTLQGTVTGRFLTYQWFRYINGTNDLPVEGATSSSLTVTVTNTVAYVLKAMNPCDTVTSNIVRLTIRPSTTIRNTSSSTQVCEGRNLTLSVSGSGPAPLTYAWRKGDPNGPVLGTGTTFTVSNAQLSSAGSYFATVTSTCTTATVEIPVTVRYVRITSQPQSVNLCSGNATLSVAVEAVGVTVSYQWKRNGTNITGATQSSYVVASSRPGTYTVEVRSACSTVTSQGAVVGCTNPRLAAEVLAEPRLEVAPNPVNGREIQCRVEGMDNPEFSLTSAAGRGLALAVKVGREPGEFVLTPRQRLAAGTYIVQASEGSRRVSQRVVVVE